MLIPLTHNQIKIAQESWRLIENKPTEFAEIFYEHLFVINPELQKLFKRSMKMQERKLVSMFSSAINCLGNIDVMTPPLEAAGKRHEQYNVKSEHYDDVLKAFQTTIEKMLGEHQTPELGESWRAILEHIMAIMKKTTN